MYLLIHTLTSEIKGSQNSESIHLSQNKIYAEFMDNLMASE